MSQGPPPVPSDEDLRLAAELRAKVAELYGKGKSVRTTEERTYAVRTRADAKDVRHAWTVIASVAACSAVAGILFTGLWFGGFVHGKERGPLPDGVPYDVLVEDMDDVGNTMERVAGDRVGP